MEGHLPDNLLTDRYLLTGRSKTKRKIPTKAFDREWARAPVGFLCFFKCKVSMCLRWKSSQREETNEIILLIDGKP